jgi:hypothetical protein
MTERIPAGQADGSDQAHRTLRVVAVIAFGVTILTLVATVVMQGLIFWNPERIPTPENEGPLGVIVFQTAFFTFSLVGFLLVWRRPTHSIGWLLLVVGLCWGVRGFFFDGYLVWTLAVRPGSLPGAPVVGALAFPLWGPAVGLMGTLLILLFPDGRVPSSRWRPVAWVSGCCVVALYVADVLWPGPVQQAPVAGLRNPFGVNALAPLLPVFDLLVLLLALCMVGCAAGLVTRFRRSRGVERLQLKWLALAAAVVGCGYLLFALASAYAALTDAGPIPEWLDVASSLLILAFVLVPVSIGIAVLRHGLYGIDRLISRTVSYLAISFTLLVVYVVLVTLVSRLTPSGNSLAVATSTLVVAALFQPLRRRVQARVDRRFNRGRYDAQRTLDAYTNKLRDQVDLDAVSSDLLHVVHETLQPASAGLWLRDVGR